MRGCDRTGITDEGRHTDIGGEFVSTFIWGKIKYNKPRTFRPYQRGNILVYFSEEKNDLCMCDLNENEVFFNIACGYDRMISLSEDGSEYLPCNDPFFFLYCPKHEKNIEPYFDMLHGRLQDLQCVIAEIYRLPEVEKITYYHTDTGNENSIDEYAPVDWKLEEFADRFLEAIKENLGFTPTVKIVFEKGNR